MEGSGSMSEEKGGRGLGRGEKAGKGGEGWEGGGNAFSWPLRVPPLRCFLIEKGRGVGGVRSLLVLAIQRRCGLGGEGGGNPIRSHHGA